MEIIHNRKKRMPLILDDEAAFHFLDASLNEKKLLEIMRLMTKTKCLFTSKGKKFYPDSKESIKPVVFTGLENEQQSLFSV